MRWPAGILIRQTAVQSSPGRLPPAILGIKFRVSVEVDQGRFGSLTLVLTPCAADKFVRPRMFTRG
jgi:hypothetical protein